MSNLDFKAGVLSFEQAYRLADLRSDMGDTDAAKLLNYSAGSAEQFCQWLESLAIACREPNKRKRMEELARVVNAMEHAGYDCPFAWTAR